MKHANLVCDKLVELKLIGEGTVGNVYLSQITFNKVDVVSKQVPLLRFGSVDSPQLHDVK